jgi:hypothetical protein
MTNIVIETLRRANEAMAPLLAIVDRISALGATPPAIADFNRRVADIRDALNVKKD